MKYYIQTIEGLSSEAGRIWKIENSEAERIDVSPSELNVFRVDSGKDVLALLKDNFPGSTFHKLLLKPGEYFPCMARPYSSAPAERLGYNPAEHNEFRHSRARSTGQLHALNGKLEQICQVIHPEKENLKAYGHEIRNILILACTEVETLWKGVLRANGEPGRATPEYVKLATPLKLMEFSVEFPYYPWLEPIKPFEKWGTSNSTSKDLEWYLAYNQTKHDREKYFAEAALGKAFEAIAACFVMLCAQYGWHFALRGEAANRAFLYLSGQPTWHPSEVYVPPFRDGLWKAKNFPFTSA